MTVTHTQAPRRIRSTGTSRLPREPDPPRIHPALPTAVALLLVLAILGALVAGVFSVKHVNVVGANLPTSEIVQAANVGGKNIFRLRADSVVRRLQTLSSINVTKVTISFPDTVTIYASRRQPYAAWRVGGITYLVDATGRIIGFAGPTTLPLIVGSAGMQPPAFGTLQAARYAVDALSNVPDGALLSSQMDPKLDLVILGRSGWKAVIGSGDPQTLVTRVATLAALMRTMDKNGQHLKFADFRFKQIYYRPK